MRRVFWAAVLLGMIWTGWWVWAAQTVQSSFEGWFAERRAEGWQADLTGIDMSGYPTRLDAQILRPALADPQTGVAVSASHLSLSAPAWWPGHVTVVFPQDAITLASPERRATLLMDQATAGMRLHPGTALELETLVFSTGPWSLSAPLGEVLAAADMQASVLQDPGEKTRYAVMLEAAGLRPGPVPRTALRVPDSWPLTFERFALNMQVGFDRVWDRRAIETARPQPRQIRISLAEAAWGTLSLRAAADLSVDAQGVPSGTLSLQARNWQELLVLAEAVGLLPSAVLPQAQSILAALAQASDDPRAIDVDLTVRDGLILLGFVPLGTAPRLLLR